MTTNIKRFTQFLLFAVLTTNLALAQSTGSVSTSSSTNLGSFYETLEESPLSLSVLAEFGTLREPKDINKVTNERYGKFNGTSLLLFPTVGFKIDDRNSLSLNSYWIKNYEKDESSDTTWTYSQINYTHSGLLNEEDHGVNLSLKLRQRVYPDNLKSENDFEGLIAGYTRPGFTLSKTLTDSLSVSWSSHLAMYNRVSGELEQPLYYLYTYPVISYSLNDKISFSGLFEYFRNEKKGITNNDETLTVTAAVDYSLNKVVTIGAYLAGDVMKAHDGNFFNKQLSKETTLTATVNLNIF